MLKTIKKFLPRTLERQTGDSSSKYAEYLISNCTSDNLEEFHDNTIKGVVTAAHLAMCKTPNCHKLRNPVP